MTRADKTATIEELKGKLENSSFFYLTDSSTMTVAQINKLRRLCHEKGVEMRVVKNTLVQKAMESFPEERGYAGIYQALAGPTAIMFTDTANTPARLLKEFRETSERPLLKAAYIDSAVFIGDDQIDTLTKLKSKEELLGEVIGLLQSPMRNLIGALNSGGQTIAGLVKALEERAG